MGGIWRDLLEWLQDFWQAATYHGAAGRSRRGRAPLTSLLLVISSLQVSIPAIGSQPHTQPNPITLLFQLTGIAAPRAMDLEHVMIRSSNIWLTAHGSYASDSLGTKHHTGKPAFSHACMQLLLLLFPWFTKPYEVYTSVIEVCRKQRHN